MAAVRDEQRYSTPELLAVEGALIARALAGRRAGAGVARHAEVERAIARRPTLSDEQSSMVRRVSLGGERVVVVVGKAGTGKTFALAAAKEAWEASGHTVVGAAVARRAAQRAGGRGGDAGHERGGAAAISSTVVRTSHPRPSSSWTRQGCSPRGHWRGCSSTSIARRASSSSSATTVSFRSSERVARSAGSPSGLRRHTSSRTDVNARPGSATRSRRYGRDAQATRSTSTSRTGARGRQGRRASSTTRLVKDWWGASQRQPAVMIALRRDDVRDLNGRARLDDAQGGSARRCVTRVARRRLQPWRRDRDEAQPPQAGVVNGERGTVVAVDAVRGSVEVDLSGRRVVLGADYLAAETQSGGASLLHGYAITGHAAQGLTTERAFVLGSDDSYREWGYAALSRGSAANHLYVVPDQRRTERVRTAGQANARSARLDPSRARGLARAANGDRRRDPDRERRTARVARSRAGEGHR